MSFLSTPEYLDLPRNPESWIVEDILPTSGLLNIYGKPKSHKSFFALQIAQAIGDPKIPDILGFPIHQHGTVAYLQVDTPRGLWADRILRWFPNNQGILMADSQIVPYPFNILGSGFKWLREAVDQAKPSVVILDTLREIHVGDENDSAHMQLVVNSLVAATMPSACILLSHSRKNMAEGGLDIMAENRGSGYVAGRCDAVAYLGKEKLHFQSRSAALESIEIIRTPLIQAKDPISLAAKRLVKGASQEAESELTRHLMGMFPSLSFDAARGRIRRAFPEGK